MTHYSEMLPRLSHGRKRSGAMAELRSRLENALRGRYTVDREVGRGGMAIVYLAHDLQLERDVALKVLRPELAVTLGPDRFLQEIRLAAGLAHPHILPLHDSGEADGLLFYVMPFCTGESLRERLEREHTLPMAEALRIAREVADALDYAHRAGVVHRDIKPENILLQDGHAVVADFGIARAISAAGAKRMTTDGMAVGTREYMSPEQAAGSTAVDGRSDIYSLGCMLFEMLTGNPPAIGTPPEGTAATASRRGDRAAALVALRPSVPLEVAGVVARMLSAEPGERFQAAGELADALAAPTGVWTPRSLAAERRRRWGAGAAAAVGLAAAVVLFGPRIFGAGLDDSLYVVVPFTAQDTVSAEVLGRNDVERLMHDAFGRWNDLHLVSELTLSEMLRRQGQECPTREEALNCADALHAGRLIWGEYHVVGDSVDVVAGLYDVRKQEVMLTAHTRVGKLGDDWGSKFDDLAERLLINEAAPAARAGAMGTTRLAAWEAYAAGHRALNEWALDSAVTAFRTALRYDGRYPQAKLWLAQALEWLGTDSTAWRREAERAAAAGDTLAPRERLLAAGLVGLATGQYPDACARYQQMVQRDPRDFAGWFGLGECQAKDRAVVRDPSSRSGWRFRSSYHAAVEAYSQALRLVPSSGRAFGLTRLSQLIFFTEPNQFRRGFALDPDTEWYAAFPSFDHDTLAFYPYPQGATLRSEPQTLPVMSYAAVAHNRDVLEEITSSWVAAFPEDPTACEAHALVLESMGDLTGTADEHSALAMIRRARSAARDTMQQLRLAVVEVRLLTKLEDFAGARRLGDSLLSTAAAEDPGGAAELSGVAALLGQVHRVARLQALAAPDLTVESGDRQVQVRPLSLARAVFSLYGYAAFGEPADSVTALADRVERLVDAGLAAEHRDALRAVLMDKPRLWAYPLLGAVPPESGHPGELERRMLWALSRKDTATVRAVLDTLHAARVDMRPGDVAITGTYLEGRIRLALGDSTGAVQVLGRSLNALSTLGSGLLSNVDQAASLVGAMALRADLADRAGDAATARRWGAAVVALWAGADDATLRGTVGRMRELAQRH
jgi:tetratricopeptide (TPR) repeat protein